MTIVRNNIRRILRNKRNIIFMIIFPVILIAVVMKLSGSGSVTVAIDDRDGTWLTQTLIGNMQKEMNVRLVSSDAIERGILNQTVDAGLVIPEGFTASLSTAQPLQVTTRRLQETNQAMPFIMQAEGWLMQAHSFAVASGGDESRFRALVQTANDKPAVRTLQEEASLKSGKSDTVVQGLGFLVMSMLMLSSMAANIMLRDKKSKMLHRVLAGPVTMRRVMGENILSFFLIIALQIVLIMSYMASIGGQTVQDVLAPLMGVSLLFGLVCVSLGTAINSVSKDMRQSGIAISMILTPMCMLGGCWWPSSAMPEVLQKIGLLMPTTWVMDAYAQVVSGTWSKLLPDCGLLLLYALVFFLMASWKKQEITA